MNILLRCDYGPNIGLGHLKRCEVLVNVLREVGDVIYIADYRDDLNLQDLLQKQDIDFQIIALSDKDTTKTVQFIENQKIDLLIIDSYQLDEEFEQAIKKSSNLAIFVVDDLFKKHDCDFLLNHNLHSKAIQYQGLVPQKTQVYCGPHFSLMAKKNQILRDEVHQREYDYFISMGASDHRNLIPQIIEMLPKAKIAVATTSLNPNLEDLTIFCNDRSNVRLYVDEKNIGLLIKKSIFAVVSASTLMIEAIYLNTVFIAINTVENQSRNMRFLQELEFPILSYKDLGSLSDLIKTVEADYDFYQEKVQLLSQKIGLKTHTLKYEVRNRIGLTYKNTEA